MRHPVELVLGHAWPSLAVQLIALFLVELVLVEGLGQSTGLEFEHTGPCGNGGLVEVLFGGVSEVS